MISKLNLMLEHTYFKNGSSGPAFFWQTQIQTIEYGLNDAMRIKKKELILMIYSLTPSDINFHTTSMSNGILENSEKSWSAGTILILSML